MSSIVCVRIAVRNNIVLTDARLVDFLSINPTQYYTY